MKKIILFISLLLFVLIHACTVNNVRTDDSLKKYFDEKNVTGTFGLFDNSRGQFTVYNLDKFKTPYLPASTFKIVNSLIALQTGRVLNDSTIIKWDGVNRPNADWNQDLSLYRAFRVSAVPHFQSIARMIGKDTMQYWLDSLKYGNMKMGPTVDNFWLDGSLTITPDEQLGLIKKLYFRQLPFMASVQETVKKMMIQENNSVYQLAFKTGWGEGNDGKAIGWMAGWIEENRHVYPFVLNIEMDKAGENSMPETRLSILKGILTDLGFFKGRM